MGEIVQIDINYLPFATFGTLRNDKRFEPTVPRARQPGPAVESLDIDKAYCQNGVTYSFIEVDDGLAMPLQICELAGKLNSLDLESLLINCLAPEAFIGLPELDAMPQVELPESGDGDINSPPLSNFLAPLSEREGAPPGHIYIAEKQHFYVWASNYHWSY